VQANLELPAEDVQLLAAQALRFGCHILDLRDGHGRVDRADVDEGAALLGLVAGSGQGDGRPRRGRGRRRGRLLRQPSSAGPLGFSPKSGNIACLGVRPSWSKRWLSGEMRLRRL
jgi:hypothetical protein